MELSRKTETYDVVKIIGRGNFGIVHLVKRKDDGKLYVLKQIPINELSQTEKEGALQEVKLLADLSCPFIVQYKESFLDKDLLHIVMHYCEGGDLHHRIKQNADHFTEAQVLDWFVQLVLALNYCHRKRIIHRDIKTQNVFLTKRGNVRLGDFGIARVLGGTTEMAMSVVGTPYSMSPEVCENKPYSYKSDVWALGCVLYELCTLKHAFDANNLLGLVWKIVQETYPPVPDNYSSELRELIRIMLSKDPQSRPSVHDILKMNFIQKRISRLVDEMKPALLKKQDGARKAEKEKAAQSAIGSGGTLSTSASSTSATTLGMTMLLDATGVVSVGLGVDAGVVASSSSSSSTPTGAVSMSPGHHPASSVSSTTSTASSASALSLPMSSTSTSAFTTSPDQVPSSPAHRAPHPAMFAQFPPVPQLHPSAQLQQPPSSLSSTMSSVLHAAPTPTSSSSLALLSSSATATSFSPALSPTPPTGERPYTPTLRLAPAPHRGSLVTHNMAGAAGRIIFSVPHSDGTSIPLATTHMPAFLHDPRKLSPKGELSSGIIQFDKMHKRPEDQVRYNTAVHELHEASSVAGPGGSASGALMMNARRNSTAATSISGSLRDGSVQPTTQPGVLGGVQYPLHTAIASVLAATSDPLDGDLKSDTSGDRDGSQPASTSSSPTPGSANLSGSLSFGHASERERRSMSRGRSGSLLTQAQTGSLRNINNNNNSNNNAGLGGLGGTLQLQPQPPASPAPSSPLASPSSLSLSGTANLNSNAASGGLGLGGGGGGGGGGPVSILSLAQYPDPTLITSPPPQLVTIGSANSSVDSNNNNSVSNSPRQPVPPDRAPSPSMFLHRPHRPTIPSPSSMHHGSGSQAGSKESSPGSSLTHSASASLSQTLLARPPSNEGPGSARGSVSNSPKLSGYSIPRRNTSTAVGLRKNSASTTSLVGAANVGSRTQSRDITPEESPTDLTIAATMRDDEAVGSGSMSMLGGVSGGERTPTGRPPTLRMRSMGNLGDADDIVPDEHPRIVKSASVDRNLSSGLSTGKLTRAFTVIDIQGALESNRGHIKNLRHRRANHRRSHSTADNDPSPTSSGSDITGEKRRGTHPGTIHHVLGQQVGADAESEDDNNRTPDSHGGVEDSDSDAGTPVSGSDNDEYQILRTLVKAAKHGHRRSGSSFDQDLPSPSSPSAPDNQGSLVLLKHKSLPQPPSARSSTLVSPLSRSRSLKPTASSPHSGVGMEEKMFVRPSPPTTPTAAGPVMFQKSPPTPSPKPPAVLVPTAPPGSSAARGRRGRLSQSATPVALHSSQLQPQPQEQRAQLLKARILRHMTAAEFDRICLICKNRDSTTTTVAQSQEQLQQQYPHIDKDSLFAVEQFVCLDEFLHRPGAFIAASASAISFASATTLNPSGVSNSTLAGTHRYSLTMLDPSSTHTPLMSSILPTLPSDSGGS